MNTSAESLTERDGAELVRLLNELVVLTQNRSLSNDLYLQYREGPNSDEGWRVGISGFGENSPHLVGGGTGLLDALRQGIAALRAEDVAEAKTQKRKKPTRRRASK